MQKMFFMTFGVFSVVLWSVVVMAGLQKTEIESIQKTVSTSQRTISDESIVDLYGETPEKSAVIIAKYGNAVKEIENLLQKEFLQLSTGSVVSPRLDTLFSSKHTLIQKIRKEYDLGFVNFTTVIYPEKPSKYITIEVIRKTDKARLQFINPIKKKLPGKNKGAEDIIDARIKFDKLETKLFLTKKLDTSKMVCPVYHCFMGFNHPELKPWLNFFNTGVVRDRQLILDALNNDPDPERRASAAFLTGHFTDAKDILSVLYAHIGDSDSRVRNNVMRVIAATLRKSGEPINIQPFLHFLDSPETTDRNKTLHILLESSTDKAAKKLIIAQAGEKLIDLLRLKQPNNHKTAWLLLKSISGRDFGEHDISAWKTWLDSRVTGSL